MSREVFEQLIAKAGALKREIHALYLAARDPRTPWCAKMLIGCVVAYALSPIDLIPDFIPLLGYLDDLLLLPIGIYLALKLIPPAVLTDARQKASGTTGKLPRSWIAAIVIVILWITAIMAVGVILTKLIDTESQDLIGG
jgi:uncharacterized membrane protein YkvA (DUF1232 family)